MDRKGECRGERGKLYQWGGYSVGSGCWLCCWFVLEHVEEACRSGSHICSSWYFPRFLFKGGSCTWMNIASLMVLDCMLTSLMYNAELVGVHWMSCGGAVEVYGGGGFKMFFNSFPQGSARFPNVRAEAVDVRALVFVDDSCLVSGWIFVFRVAKSCP